MATQDTNPTDEKANAPPYDATDEQREREADTLRQLADDLNDDLHEFADAVEANDGDPETYYSIVASIGSLHPALEGAAECGGRLDAYDPAARAICAAFEGVHHATRERTLSAALMALSSAAEYAEQARDE